MKKLEIRPYVLGFLSAGILLTAIPTTVFALKYSDKAWSAVLKRCISSGQVDYAAVKKDTQLLKDYLDGIRLVTSEEYASWPKEEKIAFWINAYNAFTIQTVIDHDPKKSIKQIPNVWDEKRFTTLGQKWSLNQIEHKILRKEFSEPRIHFALVCASLGCPILRDEPYTANDLNNQLDSQVRDFMADRNKARYDPNSDTLRLSPIFKWYREDFEKAGGVTPPPDFVPSARRKASGNEVAKSGGGVIAFLQAKGKHYLPPDMEGNVSPKTKISWLGYDWGLNDIKFPSRS